MNDDDFLNAAINIAVNDNRNSRDEYSQPRVVKNMWMMTAAMPDIQLASIAAIYNVLEHGNYHYRHLEQVGFSERILSAVSALKREEGQSMEEYVDQLISNKDAVSVKLLDIGYDLKQMKESAFSHAWIDKLKKVIEEDTCEYIQ